MAMRTWRRSFSVNFGATTFFAMLQERSRERSGATLDYEGTARSAGDRSPRVIPYGGTTMSYLANLITKNHILGALRLDDLDFMQPHLEHVPLQHGEVLIAPDRRIE